VCFVKLPRSGEPRVSTGVPKADHLVGIAHVRADAQNIRASSWATSTNISFGAGRQLEATSSGNGFRFYAYGHRAWASLLPDLGCVFRRLYGSLENFQNPPHSKPAFAHPLVGVGHIAHRKPLVRFEVGLSNPQDACSGPRMSTTWRTQGRRKTTPGSWGAEMTGERIKVQLLRESSGSCFVMPVRGLYHPSAVSDLFPPSGPKRKNSLSPRLLRHLDSRAIPRVADR